MKIIFLDFDGVLNARDTVPEFSLDASLVARLNVLIERTGAKIVISSTWRLEGLPHCLTHLGQAGFNGEVIDRTPRIEREWGERSPPRGLEIQQWLDVHPEVTSFVILDDDADMEHLLPRLVKTSFVWGLQDEHVERAITMLEAPCPVEHGNKGGP